MPSNSNHSASPNPKPKMDPGNVPVPEYTFDDWKQLYESNPTAFESRRQSVLAIELSKMGPRGARARVCLANLENALHGKTGPERARISLLWVAESALQLKVHLDALQPLLKTGNDELEAR